MAEDNERRAISLAEARADGWFERLSDGAESFEQLSEVIGRRFVAFSVIAGVRIVALTVDRTHPDASLVDFAIGQDDREHRMPLGEFRRRLAAALLSDEPEPEELPAEPSVEHLQVFLGLKYVLLAPLFGMTLKTLHVGARKPVALTVEIDGDARDIDLLEFHETLRHLIATEVDRVRQSSPFAIDLQAIAAAEVASREEDYEQVISLLGAWPGPLSLLLRTVEGQRLSPPVRNLLARSLGLLGTAYVETGKFEWAEEVMRLGIQWGQDSIAGADLFRRLGAAYVSENREAEAIGLLRRSLALGAAEVDVLPMLAECFLARGKLVAARVCIDEALGAGVDAARVEGMRRELDERLGERWTAFRARVPAPEIPKKTLQPPGRE